MASTDDQIQAVLQAPLPKRPRRRYNHRQLKPVPTLPDEIIEEIFYCLPIKNAVQVAVVAKKFRYSWASSRKLHFNKAVAKGLGDDDFRFIVDKTIHLHEGNIDSFKLYFNQVGHDKEAEIWIKKCIQKNVKELDLDFQRIGIRFGIPHKLIDAKCLQILKLKSCWLLLPADMKGLCNLHTLVFKNVRISTRSMTIVFESCMSLETLELNECPKIHDLYISGKPLKRFKVLKILRCRELSAIFMQAPTLQIFHYIGEIPELQLYSMFKLKDLLLYAAHWKGPVAHDELASIIYDIDTVQVLSTTAALLESLCPKFSKGEFKEEPYVFLHLKELQLYMKGALYCSPYDIILFIRSCPSLDYLFIDFDGFSFACEIYWELFQQQKFESYGEPLLLLRFIKLRGFKFQEFELMLAKFFLEKAICLEEFVIVMPKPARGDVAAAAAAAAPLFQSYYQHLQHWKLSQSARITICQDGKDWSSFNPTHPRCRY